MPDVDSHGALRAVGLVVPDPLVQHLRRKYLAGVLHEELENVILGGRKVDLLAVNGDFLAAVVEAYPVKPQTAILHRAAAELHVAP